jgi:putative alpha-1,2-mannosidase
MERPARRCAAMTIAVVAALSLVGCTQQSQSPRQTPEPALTSPVVGTTTDDTRYVDNDQGPGQVFLRYPLGRIGLWSVPDGDLADSVTRGLALYPTLGPHTAKPAGQDWRANIAATPEQATITYRQDTPAAGVMVGLTVTPDIAVYRYLFPPATVGATASTGLAEVNLLIRETENSNVTWSDSTLAYLSPTTVQVRLRTADGSGQAFFFIRTSAPALCHGTFTANTVTAGATTITGDGVGGFLCFHPGSTVTVAVALSMTSMTRAQAKLAGELPAMDFDRAVRKLDAAWNAVLGKVQVTVASPQAATELYTALYTLYANIVDVTDNASGYQPVAPSRRLLTIGSSIWWERVGGGYFRCSFDQGRNAYALLTLLDPAAMRDVLNTYLAQYRRDGFLMGNWDPFDPNAWAGQQWGFFGYYFLAAKLEGVTGIDYPAAERAILATMGRQATSRFLVTSGYYAHGYIPADGGVPYFLSRGLEFATDLAGLAHLAYVLGDAATYREYARYGTAYQATFNPATTAFQGRNANGSWAPLGAGLFEGDPAAYAFDEPQDGQGLAARYGDAAMASRIAAEYARPDVTYNDFQVSQPYLAIEADAPAVAQQVIRNDWLPMFAGGSMWESPPGGGSVYYTDNASAVVLGSLGIYPLQSPGAQWLVNSPAIGRAVIHGLRTITIVAPGNTQRTPYLRTLTVDGARYPSLFIAGETLTRADTTITLGMSAVPARIAPGYLTAADAELLAATARPAPGGGLELRLRVDPLGDTARLTVHATTGPAAITVNGRPLPPADWSYQPATRLLLLHGVPPGVVDIRLR